MRAGLVRATALAGLVAALVLGCAGPAGAQVSEVALRDAAQRRDFAAVEAFAATGDVRAEVQLARMLESAGRDAEAWAWWQRAAGHGDPSAIRDVARRLDREGRPAEAVGWWRRAAEAGQGYAQIELGDHLRRGDGVPADPAEALRWYSAAARQGISVAFLLRAELLAGADGVQPDPVEAYANAMVAEIVADDSELEQWERAAAVREALDDRLTRGERAAAWVRAQELWPGLRQAWWKGLVLPGLFLRFLGWLAATAGFALFLAWMLIRWIVRLVLTR